MVGRSLAACQGAKHHRAPLLILIAMTSALADEMHAPARDRNFALANLVGSDDAATTVKMNPVRGEHSGPQLARVDRLLMADDH